MACPLILYFFLTLTVLPVCNPLTSYHVDVNIFVKNNDTEMRYIVQEATGLVHLENENISLKNGEGKIQVNLRTVSYNEAISSIFTLDQDLVFNITVSLRSAIFVQISNHEIFLSSLMEGSNIVTVGLFQTKTNPFSQERPVSFTRIASPSMIDYASTIKDVMKKMGWRILSLVLSADYEGTVFAGEMIKYKRKEKWNILHTVWIPRCWGNGTELKSMLKEVLSNESDVVIVHMRDSRNDEIFQLLEMLGVKNSRPSWLLTDVTTFGVSIVNLPAGSVKISPWTTLNRDYMVHALRDAVNLIALSAAAAIETSGNNEIINHQSIKKDSKALQRAFKQMTRNTFFQGKTSIFENLTMRKGHFATMDISHLEQDLHGVKHWTTIGLSTYSEIAVAPFKAPNGQIQFPLLEPYRPILRVPVVFNPPWVMAAERIETYDKELKCMEREHICYNKTASSNKTLCCFGFSIELLKILQRELQFVPEIYFVADGFYGIFDEKTGKWNGIVRELVLGIGDLALGLSLSGKRAEYIEFSWSYLPLALNVIVEKRDIGPGVHWFSWLEPFDFRLWLTIGGTNMLILLVIWWLDRKSPRGHYHFFKESDEDGLTLLDSMSYVWGVAFGKEIGADKAPRSLSARLVSSVFAFVVLILANSYSANLMAFLVQDNFLLPIEGIKDPKLRDPSLHPPNGFQIGILQGSFTEMYFRINIHHEFRQLYNNSLKVKTFDEGIDKLNKGEIQGLVGDYLSLHEVAHTIPGCRYSPAGPDFYTHGVAFSVPKGSPWLEDVNRVVTGMKTNGSFQRIEKVYFDKKKCSSSAAKNLSILNLSGLFLTVAVAVAVCFSALFVEVIIIFILARNGQYLGHVGKVCVRFLFNLRKGEEHLITLSNSTIMQKRSCVRVECIEPVNENQHNSINAPIDLEQLQSRMPGRQRDGVSSDERTSTAQFKALYLTSGFHNASLTPEDASF